jgi:two-component system phosphate regulon response regulator PhoB
MPARILIVEDDPDQARLFSDVLQMSGYDVITVSDVEAALAATREGQPDLALIDWDLPGIKGDAYILMVKVEFPAVKTVLFSNHADVEQAANTVGADGWMLKIEGILRLQELVRALLQQA